MQRSCAVLKRCPCGSFQHTIHVVQLNLHPDRGHVLASLHVLCMGRVPRSASSKSPQRQRPTLKLCVGAVLRRSSAAMLAAATLYLRLSYMLSSMGFWCACEIACAPCMPSRSRQCHVKLPA